MTRGTVKLLLTMSRNEQRELVHNLLSRSEHVRFSVKTADSFATGSEMASQGAFDCMIMDLDLPDMKGLDAVVKLRERAPRIPLIILTDGKDHATIEKALSHGAQNQAILGHFDETTLPSIIHCAIEKKNMEEANKTLKVANSILRHDIMNNLMVVGGSLDIYRMKKDEKFLQSATNAVDRTVELIKRMKELESVISPKEMKQMDVRTVVEEVINKYSTTSKAHFTVTGDANVLADEALTSVFDNIINNALTHSETHAVNITIRPGDSESGLCEIRVADEGVGIPAEVKPKIWQEGFKYGKSGQSGLGLFIVKRVLERYGASVTVEDNRPKGSVFVIHLRCG